MTLLIVALLAAAALTLGLRLTTGLIARLSHPIDRLVFGTVVGLSIVWLTLVASARYHVFEAGLGLLVSLAPVGIWDLARWWGRARRPFGPWIIGTRGPLWVVAVRGLAIAGLMIAGAGAIVAIGGVLTGP